MVHLTSDSHMLATAADSQRPITEIRKDMKEQEKASYVAAMRSAYWLIIEEVPNGKHASLLNLQKIQGCHDITQLRRGGNSSKESPWSFNQFLEAMNEVYCSHFHT